ncbi:MarR family transcriptional regulator [Conexibacter sp. W3-3-2]|uniref:MarR family transcriptional regulator n=1 Tax=Paraconexibacter algicola TaxID=2133960 RepID=A0A2T4UJU1_9ACTN|nr:MULTISPECIES: MarR family transcriptional regulator [Solirubrobacterales]MTD45858.1 MarR family transcriptional regulator [Conexibacter sp. W3-3-2]PTL59512.1 MarR family transcriptional regulator [Paraconexibacter algicola]
MAREPEPDPVEWVRERWEEQGLPEAERFAAAASLMRAHAVAVQGFEAALRPHELTRTQYLVLVTLQLSPGGARRLSYLSRYLMVHQTTITQLVDQFEQRGLVTREPHPTDRRTTLAVLTRSGRALLKRATKDAAAAGFGLGPVDDTTVGELTGSLRAMRRATGDLT